MALSEKCLEVHNKLFEAEEELAMAVARTRITARGLTLEELEKEGPLIVDWELLKKNEDRVDALKPKVKKLSEEWDECTKQHRES